MNATLIWTLIVAGVFTIFVSYKLWIYFVYLRPAKKRLAFLRSPDEWKYQEGNKTDPVWALSWLIYNLNLGGEYNSADSNITKIPLQRIGGSKQELDVIRKKAYFWRASLCVTFLREGMESVDLELLKDYLRIAGSQISDLVVTEEDLTELHKRQQIRAFTYYWKKLRETNDPLFFLAAQKQLEEAGLTFDDVGLSAEDINVAMAQIGKTLKSKASSNPDA